MSDTAVKEKREKKSFGGVAKEYLAYAGNSIKYFVKNDYQLIWAFFLPFIILLASYALFGVWPMGKESVLSLDLNGQYVFYYDHMYDVLYGDESLFYSWSRNLSGEFMGIIGYYLASPFSFIVWMFPRTMITEGLLTMMVVKVGAIGLCMGIYLTYGKRCSKLTTIIFSVGYALCAYTIVQTMNPMWLDGVGVLPLICLGLERFIDEGRFRLLTLSLVYGFVTCFYIGYMLAIFSVIYFIYYVTASEKDSARDHLLKKFFGFGGIGILSAMCSAFMILPVYESLALGKFEFSVPDYSLRNNFELISLLDKLLPGSYDTVRMVGLPFIYCGMLTVLLLPAYFFMKKFSGRERIASAVVILVLLVCMYIRPVDMMWHGGQMPNWLPYRYSFMVSFMMCAMAAKAFEYIKEMSGRYISAAAVAWFAIIVWQESIDHVNEDIKKGADTLSDFGVILPSILILLVISALVAQNRKRFNMNFKKTASSAFSIILIGAVCSEALFNTTMQIYAQDKDIVYSDRTTYLDFIPRLRETVEGIKENDKGFYRIEKQVFRSVNDPMALNMYGLSHSSSTLNAKPIELLKRLGFTARSHYTRYSGATRITSSLFGVKYELSTPNNTQEDVRNGVEIIVTENPYTLPVCYLADDDIMETELKEYDPFAAQNQMLGAMVGAPDAEFFHRIYDVDMVPENVSQSATSDSHHSFKVITAGKNAQLTYTVVMPVSGDLYLYLPSRYERKVNLYVNKVSKGTYFEGDNNYMRNLGTFQAGEEVEIILTLTKDDLYFREAEFAYIDEDKTTLALETLQEVNKNTVVERLSTTHLKIELDADQEQVLFTSIPVEKGWTVLVDGEKVEYETALDAIIAVPVTDGHHTVELIFTTAGYPIALIITVAGIVLFIFLAIIWRKTHKEALAVSKAHRMEICSGEARKRIVEAQKADYEQYLAESASQQAEKQDGTDPEGEVTEEITDGVFKELADDESLPSENEMEDGEDDPDFYKGLGTDSDEETGSGNNNNNNGKRRHGRQK